MVLNHHTGVYISCQPEVGIQSDPLPDFATALLGTLVLAPHGLEMLFKLTLTTLSLSLLGHLIYGIALGMLLPYVHREKRAGTAPGMAAIGRSRDVLEALASAEETVILPPLLRMRPIWEHKTTQLSVVIQ